MSLQPGQIVRYRDDPARCGTVTAETRPRGGELQYRVNWGHRADWHYEDELEPDDGGAVDPLDLIRQGSYGGIDELRRLLTHVHLAGRLANVIYSMGLTQTDFYPHQYKPLLTLLDSPVNGLLIADEVGLGKTIEAGLIWTELRARHDLRRLLVVCPAMLREKWRAELVSRFGIDARAIDADELLRELKAPERKEGAWIISYQGIRVPANWDPVGPGAANPSARSRLADLLYGEADAEPLLDLVIFDEAHYMRNEQTATWRTGELLRDVSAHQVMLSATPVNLGSSDLFNLLRLLDPDHFRHWEDFSSILQSNRPVIAASDLVRNARSTADQIHNAIDSIRNIPRFAGSDRLDRLMDFVAGITEWTKERRVETAARLERLNLLAHVVTRTRKREVQTEQVIRDATTVQVAMTEVERRFYDAVTQGTREYAMGSGIGHGFLLAMPQRMAASCPAALLQNWRNGRAVAEDADDVAALIDDVDGGDDDEESLRDNSGRLRGWLRNRKLAGFDVDELIQNDSKFAKLREQLRRLLNEDSEAKVIIFTTFRGTATYLTERLRDSGVNAGVLMGGQRMDKAAVVRAFKEDPLRRVLVCTDVAAEGVDLQFCRLVVNYDLPWNPMRVEQRIGRIDRIGQRSKRILIWNFVHSDTIDARILVRLIERVGVFESTLGETAEIIGKVRQLEDALLSRTLTPEEEERLIDSAALAIQNVRHRQEQLEKEAIQLVAHGEQLLSQIDAARREGRIVSLGDLIRYVEGHLKPTGSRFTAVPGEPHLYEIELEPQVAAQLDAFVRGSHLVGRTHLGSGRSIRCRFAEQLSERPTRGEEIIHRLHPLVRFLSQRQDTDGDPFPLYAARIASSALPAGRYALATKRVMFKGAKDEDHLLVVGVDIDSQQAVDLRSAEQILDLVRRDGLDWPAVAFDIDRERIAAAVEQCEQLLRASHKTLVGEKRSEYDDRIDMLLQSLDDHLEAKRAAYRQRIANHESAADNMQNSRDRSRRRGLAQAERKKLGDFEASMETRRSKLTASRQSFSADSQDLCVVVVDVLHDESRA